jgi:hypothetical protein
LRRPGSRLFPLSGICLVLVANRALCCAVLVSNLFFAEKFLESFLENIICAFFFHRFDLLISGLRLCAAVGRPGSIGFPASPVANLIDARPVVKHFLRLRLQNMLATPAGATLEHGNDPAQGNLPLPAAFTFHA